MVADRHGLAGAGMAAAATAMLLPAALLHDDDAMACLLCLPAGAEPLPYHFKISSVETREGATDQPSFCGLPGCWLGPVFSSVLGQSPSVGGCGWELLPHPKHDREQKRLVDCTGLFRCVIALSLPERVYKVAFPQHADQ